jgi:hypothetical protein
MTPTRVPALAVIAAVFAVMSWLILRLVYSALPPLPWSVVLALVIAAAAEAWTGRELRARILGRQGTKPAEPIYVARMAVLAKATAQAAAVLAGIAIGFVAQASGSLYAPVPRHDAITAGAGFGACVVLAAAALYLEYCCRVPGGGDGQRNAPPYRSAGRSG